MHISGRKTEQRSSTVKHSASPAAASSPIVIYIWTFGYSNSCIYIYSHYSFPPNASVQWQHHIIYICSPRRARSSRKRGTQRGSCS